MKNIVKMQKSFIGKKYSLRHEYLQSANATAFQKSFGSMFDWTTMIKYIEEKWKITTQVGTIHYRKEFQITLLDIN